MLSENRQFCQIIDFGESEYKVDSNLKLLERCCQNISEDNISVSIIPVYHMGSAIRSKAKESKTTDHTAFQELQDRGIISINRKWNTVKRYVRFAAIVNENHAYAFVFGACCSWFDFLFEKKLFFSNHDISPIFFIYLNFKIQSNTDQVGSYRCHAR